MKSKLPRPLLVGLALAVAVGGCGTQSSGGRTTSSSVVARTTAPVVTAPASGGGGQRGSGCRAAMLAVVISQRSSYVAGDPVVLSVTVRNVSQRACSVPTGACVPQVIVSDARGAVLWNRAATGTTCMFGPGRSLRPGQRTHVVVHWNGRRCGGATPADCPGTPARPGTYRVAASWVAAAAGTLRITS